MKYEVECYGYIRGNMALLTLPQHLANIAQQTITVIINK